MDDVQREVVCALALSSLSYANSLSLFYPPSLAYLMGDERGGGVVCHRSEKEEEEWSIFKLCSLSLLCWYYTHTSKSSSLLSTLSLSPSIERQREGIEASDIKKQARGEGKKASLSLSLSLSLSGKKVKTQPGERSYTLYMAGLC